METDFRVIMNKHKPCSKAAAGVAGGLWGMPIERPASTPPPPPPPPQKAALCAADPSHGGHSSHHVSPRHFTNHLTLCQRKVESS